MNCLWRRFARPISILSPVKPEITIKPLHRSLCYNVNRNSTVASFYPNFVNCNIVRYKSKKAKNDSDDEEEVYSEDTSLSKDSKIVKFNTTSMRTDVILKSALAIARNKIETQFYESRIRVNGKKIMKKSASVRVGDEVDIVKMISPKNSDHLYIYRVEILNAVASDESIVVTARRFKNLLIENYEKDPYKGNAESEN